MRINATTVVKAPVADVWMLLADPERYLDFLFGVTRWEVVGPRRAGIGARYRILMRVGAAEIGGLVETVEFTPQRDLAWTSVTGLDQRGRMRVREAGPDRARVEFRLAYGVAGAGLSGWLAERLAAPAVRANLKRSLRRLRRIAEQEQLRRRAVARRERTRRPS